MLHIDESPLKGDSIKSYIVTPHGYEFQLKGIPTDIQIQFRVNPSNKKYAAEFSHFIKTPEQAGPYQFAHQDDDINWMLMQAVSAFTQYYDEAVAKGHKPEAAWLRHNKAARLSA